MVGDRLRSCAESGAFHVDVGAAVMDTRTGVAACGEENLPEFFADRVRKRNVRDNPASEKGVLSRFLGAIDELVDQDNVARSILCLERTNGADADDPCDVEFFETPNIGAVIELAREDAVTTPVSGQEHHFAPFKITDKVTVRGRSERGFDLHPVFLCQAFHFIEAGAANYSNPVFVGCCFHVP